MHVNVCYSNVSEVFCLLQIRKLNKVLCLLLIVCGWKQGGKKRQDEMACPELLGSDASRFPDTLPWTTCFSLIANDVIATSSIISVIIIIITFTLSNCMHAYMFHLKKVTYLNSYLIGTSDDIETPTIIYSMCEYIQPWTKANGPIPKLFHLAESVPAVVHTWIASICM